MTHTNSITLEDLEKAKRALEDADVPAPYFVWAAYPLNITLMFLGYTLMGEDLYAYPV